MLEKQIEFIAPKSYFNLKQDYPKPIKLNIPDWYKKLEHSVNNRTIKGCIPVLDSLTFGYSLSIPVDISIHHNVTNKDKNGKEFKDSFYGCPIEKNMPSEGININDGTHLSNHPIGQLEGSPHVEKNKNLPFYKIANPWIIKTPPGYSCLFVPPLNNEDDRFTILPAIVDTDTFHKEINFPIVLNGDKYPNLETTLKKGTPYAQVIPFKRNNWKMKLSTMDEKKNMLNNFLYPLRMLHTYKLDFWNKKSCK